MQPAVVVVALLLPLSALLRLGLLATATAETNLTSGNDTSCMPVTCGGLNITYPFSLVGVQPLYCGYPSFALTCDDGNSVYLSRTFRENLYLVQSIFYGNSSMVVAVENSFSGDGTCKIPDFNVSSALGLFPVNISATNRHDLTFVYNCEVPHSKQLTGPCAKYAIGAYISERPAGTDEQSTPPWVRANCSSASVPVRGFQDGTNLTQASVYERFISDGFLLEWPTLGDCDACKRTGGQCRFFELAFRCVNSSTSPGRNSTRNIDYQNFSHQRFRRNNTRNKIVGIVCGVGGCSLAYVILVWHMRKRRKARASNGLMRLEYPNKSKANLNFFLCKKITSATERNIEALILLHGTLAPKRYKYSEAIKITSSLSNKLGEGGYGMVFKGRLDDGRLVAVKLLHESKGEGEEFVNEVMSIGRTSHVNIVSLFGFCLEGTKRALIYEYMPKGSLDKYIYSENPKAVLGWDKLYMIAVGIARGLEYLHHSCNTRIVHFDIKPQNILLDEDFHPKIADFGLAKLCHTKESKLSMTGARGTVGFIAPEVHSRTFGIVSTKSDVYSYGMMLLEMVGGRKNVKSCAQDSSQKYFPHWIYDHFGQDDGLLACEVTHENEGIAKKMSVIGMWCIQILPLHRPTITKVLEMFERGLDELDMPPRQNFSQILEDPAYNFNAENLSTSSGTKIEVSK